MCRLLIDAHAPFVARKLATDHDLTETISQALAAPGFSLIEIVELCTEYGTSKNELTGSALTKLIRDHGQELGVLKASSDRQSFGFQYAAKFPATAHDPHDGGIAVRYPASLRRKIGIFLAGSAGERVQSSAATFCEAAVAAGLYCTQKNDNPVTQGSGFSLSEVCLSNEEIHYTGIDRPDVLIAVSKEGLDELTARGSVAKLTPASVLVVDASLAVFETSAQVWRFPFRSRCGVNLAAAGALMFVLHRLGIFPAAAFQEAFQSRYKLQEAQFPEEFFNCQL
jgi:Pyruvate/2-oxoacid:ferredoxin oxidoreductase gamma subunit